MGANNGTVNIHQGHRQRVKNRFLEHGLDTFDDYQLLEILLFYAVPKKDTNEMAHMLINKFGSLCGVLRADYEELMEVKGIGENAASLIKFFQMFAQRFLREEFENDEERKSMDSTQNAKEYCQTLYLGETHESVYAVALDADLCVVKAKRLFTGTPDSVAISPRSIIEFVIKCKCNAVLLSHNHPNGSCLPSKTDYEVTKIIGKALNESNMLLVDHIIVGRDGVLSVNQRML